MLAEELKEILEHSAANKFLISLQPDIFELAKHMLAHIGSPDSRLRDDLIYSAFYHWLLERSQFDNNQLGQILETALDDSHLFWKLGEKDTDSIFTRSFSLLLIALILLQHRQQSVFTHSEISKVNSRLMRYATGEKDNRGFVPVKGWAHAIAHLADVIDELAQCEETGANELHEMLRVVSEKMRIPDTPLVHGEFERMATATLSILRRSLITEKDITNWLLVFEEVFAIGFISPADFAFFNAKHFLQSLYFALRANSDLQQFSEIVLLTLPKS
jgi:hypothetical protein